MRVMFLVGMPGSGKSTLAKLITERIQQLKPKWECRCVEMSDVVKGWLEEAKNNNNIWATRLKNKRLQELLYKRIKGDFCVVSGVREQWIINEWKTTKVVIFLNVEKSVRKKRYQRLKKDKKYFRGCFGVAELRAEQMKVPEMIRYATVVIYSQGLVPSDTAEDIIRSAFNYDLTHFIQGEVEEPK